MRLSRIHLWAMGAVVVCGVVVIGIALLGWQLRGVEDSAISSCFVLLAYCVVGFGCAMAYEDGRAPRLMRSGLLAALAAAAGWLLYVWAPGLQWEYDLARVAIWPTVWACLMMLVGLLLMPRRPAEGWRILRLSTIVLLSALALVIALGVALYPAGSMNYMMRREYEDIAYKVGGTLTMLAAAALVLTVVGFWLTPRRSGGVSPSTTAYQRPFWLECPRCGAAQDARTGPHSCTRCGLRVRVELT